MFEMIIVYCRKAVAVGIWSRSWYRNGFF